MYAPQAVSGAHPQMHFYAFGLAKRISWQHFSRLCAMRMMRFADLSSEKKIPAPVQLPQLSP